MDRLYQYLTYAGAIPFIGCAVLLFLGIQILPVLGEVTLVLSCYGLIIATFLAGSYWGQHLHTSGVWSLSLIVVSNSMAVLLWLAFLALSTGPFLAFLGITFLFFLLVDRFSLAAEAIDYDYFLMRSRGTVLVVATLVVVGFIL